jgi:WD40 repeat protein
VAVFNWLHLTDLHLGMSGSEDLWPNVEDDFFEDLAFLTNRVGSLDLVLFTGDFVQRGSHDEFERIGRLLQGFRDKLRATGSDPVFLAVPGNHDLVRPNNTQDPALVALMSSWDDADVQNSFWEDSTSPHRKIVNEAFANYVEWWQNASVPKPEVYTDGMLPGDFSATIEKDGAKIGVVGLNTAFLQLTGDNCEGRLALHIRQFHKATGGHGPNWVRKHHTCLLLTHHPPDWLTEAAQSRHLEGEIHSPPRRFALHLFGHMHEPQLRTVALGGAGARRRLQGCSLFAVEGWGEQKTGKRIHGYSIGQLDVATAKMRIWPRKVSERQGSFRQMDRDGSFSLPRGEEATEWMPVELLSSPAVRTGTRELSESNVISVHEEQSVTDYNPGGVDADFSDFFIKVSNVKDVGPLDTLSKPLSLHDHSERMELFSVAFSPNGDLLASGGKEQKVEIWSMEPPEHCRSLKVPNMMRGDVHSVTFSPHADMLASSGFRDPVDFMISPRVRLWRVDDGEILDELKEWDDERGAGDVNSVAFSPKADLLATGSISKGLLLWNVEAEKLVFNRPLYVRTSHQATSVAFSPEGKLLASGTRDALIRVWGVNGSHIRTLRGHEGPVSSVAFSPRGEVLASASKDEQTVRLWDLKGSEQSRVLQGHEGPVSSVAFSPDGEMLVSGSTDKSVRLWRVGDGSLLHVLQGREGGPVSSVAFSPKGWEIASASAGEEQVRLWGLPL